MRLNAEDVAAGKSVANQASVPPSVRPIDDQHNGATHDKAEDARLLRTKCHADAYLAGALGNSEGEKTVQARRTRSSGQERRRTQGGSNKFLAAEGVFNGLMDRLDIGGCCIGRDFVKSLVKLRAQARPVQRRGWQPG